MILTVLLFLSRAVGDGMLLGLAVLCCSLFRLTGFITTWYGTSAPNFCLILVMMLEKFLEVSISFCIRLNRVILYFVIVAVSSGVDFELVSV